jgi:hypothetical protein
VVVERWRRVGMAEWCVACGGSEYRGRQEYV